MNTNYGKLEERRFTYAPDALDTERGKLMNPTDADYLAAGWKRVVDTPPEPEEGMEVKTSSWRVEGDEIIRVYKQKPKAADGNADAGGEGGASGGGTPPAPLSPMSVRPRRFSKLKLVIALKAAGLWVLTKTWLEENGLYDYYLAAQEFAEDNEFFVRARTELMVLARLTDERVEEILAGCILDE